MLHMGEGEGEGEGVGQESPDKGVAGVAGVEHEPAAVGRATGMTDRDLMKGRGWGGSEQASKGAVTGDGAATDDTPDTATLHKPAHTQAFTHTHTHDTDDKDMATLHNPASPLVDPNISFRPLPRPPVPAP